MSVCNKIIISFICGLLISIQSVMASDLKSATKFKIFSGDKKASYYAVASGICNVFNRHFANQGFECVALESKGSEANLKLLASGEADLAVIKTSEFNKFFIQNSEGLQSKTELVAKIHDEYLTLLVQKNLLIKSISDLDGKTVNIGSLGSTSALIVQKYFSEFVIKPREIVNFGAAESFEKLCDKKIDAWVYFIGHPNNGFREALQKCDLEIVAIPQNEIDNFLKNLPFLKERVLAKDYYQQLQKDLKTVSSPTILAAKKGFNKKVIELIRDILANYKEELLKEGQIFKSF